MLDYPFSLVLDEAADAVDAAASMPRGRADGDDALLDAYSRTVAGIAEQVAPPHRSGGGPA